MGRPDDSSSPFISFVKGLLTGTIEAVICYPTELVKTQLQLQSKQNPQYKGMMDCATKTVQQHGIRGLYTGALPLIMGSSAKQAARWTAYDKASDQFTRDAQGRLSVPANMFCGFVAGTSEALLAVTPMETLKTRVADDQRQGTKNYKGSVDALVKILKKDGPMGVYRGPIPTVLKQGTNQMVRFPFQQFFLGLLAGDDAAKKKNPLYSGLAGAFAGAASVIVTMPQDTVKTRMQSEGGNLKYKGTLDCLKQIVNQHGIGFLWSGTMPRLVRVSLDVGITFTIMPYLTSILGK